MNDIKNTKEVLEKKIFDQEEIIIQLRTVIYCYENRDRGQEIVAAFNNAEEPSTDKLIDISRKMLLRDSENATSPHEWRLCERLIVYQLRLVTVLKQLEWFIKNRKKE